MGEELIGEKKRGRKGGRKRKIEKGIGRAPDLEIVPPPT